MSLEHNVPGQLDQGDSRDLVRVPTEGSSLSDPAPDRPTPTQWKPSSRTVEETLAEGLSNEDLWMLIRRFNKQIYHVKAVPDSAGQKLDLNRAEDEQFPPEKLRMTLERFYTSVVVGLIEFFRHVGRLHSWKERRRSLTFCTIYFIAWFFDLLIPTLFGLMAALIMIPSIRPLLFPPPEDEAPTDGGGPVSGQPESHDSLTGAPEHHKGETAEQEAKNLIDSVASVAMETASGRYGQAVSDDTTAEAAEENEEQADPQPDDAVEDKTKKPIRSKTARGTDKAMRVVSDITDVYEQFANLFSPTPPFYLVSPRLRLAGTFTTISLVMTFVQSYWIIKAIGFTIGLVFFGGPIFTFTTDLLNRKVPNWKDHLDIQKTLLEGVPTNAQLTLTLLRIGEINSSPLPPPPDTSSDEPSWPIKRKKSKATTISTLSEANPSNPSLTTLQTTSTETLPASDPNPKPKPKRRFILRVLKFVRRTIATAIKGHIAMDRAMAIAGSSHTKHLLGMLQARKIIGTPFGPLKFDAKFERKRGAAVIDSSKEPPVLYFTTYQSAGLEDLRIEARKKGSVLFQIPVTDIVELKKTEGLGWKGKLIVELTAGSKEAADGLVVIGREGEGSGTSTGGAAGSGPGPGFHLTGMRSRNQLFNRLVAIDAQFWESR